MTVSLVALVTNRGESIGTLHCIFLFQLVACLSGSHMETVSDFFMLVLFNLDVGLFDVIKHVLHLHVLLLAVMVRVSQVLGCFRRIGFTHD